MRNALLSELQHRRGCTSVRSLLDTALTLGSRT